MTARGMNRLRLFLWIGVLVVAVAATALFVVRVGQEPVDSAMSFGGGTYSLVDQRGDPVDQTMFQGHPSLLFFGYTHCPDVCPTTMAEMAIWFQTLGDSAKDLKAYFVTVDPERDTPEVLGGYVSWVSDRITGITGARPEIDKIIKAWHVVAEKVPGSDGNYTMNHTASVFLLDRKGAFTGTIGYGEETQSALRKIERLVSG
jgi:protein SCO1/2